MVRRCLLTLLVCVWAAGSAAQVPRPAPPPGRPPSRPADEPPPGWVASAGLGIAVTSGNRDTSTLNVTYDLLHDGGGMVILKSTGVYLRGQSEGQPNVDRASADLRTDVRVAPRLFAFGQVGYFRDRFKDVEYLVSPAGGLSVALLSGPRVDLSADGSLGFAFEKEILQPREATGALFAGQTLSVHISEAARLTQSVRALWKMNGPSDALYVLSAGLTSSIASRANLKVELLDTFKNRPTDPALGRNDVSFLVSVVYKIF